jgi:hypothetical protein
MPFLFLISGIVLIVASVRGTNQQLVTLLKGDFTGQDNFLYWSVSILLIGAIGYIDGLKPVSRAFLVLVVIVLFIKNKGVFQQFTQALNLTQQQPQSSNTTITPSLQTTQQNLTELIPSL